MRAGAFHTARCVPPSLVNKVNETPCIEAAVAAVRQAAVESIQEAMHAAESMTGPSKATESMPGARADAARQTPASTAVDSSAPAAAGALPAGVSPKAAADASSDAEQPAEQPAAAGSAGVPTGWRFATGLY